MDVDVACPAQFSPADALALVQALAICRDGVLILDAQGGKLSPVYANPVFHALGGRTARQPPSLAALAAPGEEQDAKLSSALEAAVRDARPQQVRLRGAHQDGSSLTWEVAITPVKAAGGAVSHLVCLVHDSTEQRLQLAQLAHFATHDDLTGLGNRSLFNERLLQAMAQSAGAGRGVAVLSLALDGFASINESLGYVVGDHVLISVAQRLRERLGEADTLTRHGGNTFVIILAQIAGPEQAAAACERLLDAMAAPVAVAGQHLHVGCSIGVALYPRDAGDGVTLLRYAEMAASQTRQHGGRRFQFFSMEMNRRSVERAQMEAALRVALAEGQFDLQYQPVAALQDGALCALEALLRWNHPQFGLIEARRFVPLAEETGLTTDIGYWCLRRALEDMRDWSAGGLPPVKVAVNLSPRQFSDPGLAHAVGAALAAVPEVVPERLSLEITEAALMQDPQASDATLNALKALGVSLTLDDFGTGYSSLNHLKRFPLDLIKIDCDLISRLGAGADEAAMVKTIVSMAHLLGIQVSAEGVETEAQCDFLRRNMCDQIQGYFFGAPCSRAEIGALMAARHSLPAHLLRIQKQARTLLLVDDEQNIVSALKRLLRRDGYQILSAYSGQEGLEVLAANAVDVIVSDQRMPGMIGADFLRAAKDLYPDTIRIMLSGYTELQSVTDAVNEGAIFKFLTKPWDDEQLRHHIAEAFRLKEIADDNERLNLELRTANQELATANRRMEELLRQKQQQITRDEISLSLARDLLQLIPLAVIGLDSDGMIAFVNAAAGAVFAGHGSLLGDQADLVLPELFVDGVVPQEHRARIAGRAYCVVSHPIGSREQLRGSLITISVCEDTDA